MRSGSWSWIALACACGGGGGDPADAPPGTPDAPAVIDAAPPDARIPMFGAPIVLSDPANASFLPAIAARGGTVVVAWHDFPPAGGSRVVTRAIVDGTPGPIEPVPDTFGGPKRPTLAVTTGGFVLAYEATDPGLGFTVIRTLDLDADGHALGDPTTVSGPGALGTVPRVAAHGDDVVFAWTDGSAHFFARRGGESVPATPVGTTLESTGILNFPRIALASTGEILLAYRDGGVGAEQWEVLVVTRPTGGAFGAPVNVSRSPGLLSDDISLAIEPDDTLDVVWVDQDPINVNSFEVQHATRAIDGTVSPPGVRFETQGLWAWTPSVVAGMTAVWHTGGGAGGELWLANAGGAPTALLPGEQGAMVALARDAAGGLHLAYVTPGTPRQIEYARSP